MTVRLLSVRGTPPSARAAAIWHTAPIVPDDPTATSNPVRRTSRTVGVSAVRMSRRQASTAFVVTFGPSK